MNIVEMETLTFLQRLQRAVRAKFNPYKKESLSDDGPAEDMQDLPAGNEHSMAK
jgi:hypothetical protein